MISFRGYLNLHETRKPRYDYSSTHVLLPDDLSASVIGWGRENIPDEDLFHDLEDRGRENEPHVTVLYGLYETNPRKVRYIVQDAKPFEARLGKIGVFKNDLFDVVKIEVKGKELCDLHDLLRDNLDHRDPFPIYTPHVTIAYVKKGRGGKFEDEEFFQGRPFPVKTVVFSSRTGDKVNLQLRGRGKS